jgi:hypothetical protein
MPATSFQPSADNCLSLAAVMQETVPTVTVFTSDNSSLDHLSVLGPLSSDFAISQRYMSHVSQLRKR